MTEAQNNAKNEEYIDSLKDEISYLKEILASKLFEEDNLINFTCREIETDYSLKFGVYKYKIKDYKLKIKKTKRTIEMIKKMVNQQSSNQFNKELSDFVVDRHINDLHCGNFGMAGDHYVMVDFSGFGSQIFMDKSE